MEMQELLKQSDAELKKLLAQYRADLHAMRFQLANMQLKNVRQVRKTRQDVARIQTILSKRAQVTNTHHV